MFFKVRTVDKPNLEIENDRGDVFGFRLELSSDPDEHHKMIATDEGRWSNKSRPKNPLALRKAANAYARRAADDLGWLDD